MRLSAAGLAGSAAHPPLRGRPQTRRRTCAVRDQSKIIERISPRSGRTGNGTLARRDADGWCARAFVRQRPSGQERGKSACGSAQKRRTLRSAQRGTECVFGKSRSSSHAPDRHPKGQDYRLGSRERIERVARRAAQFNIGVAPKFFRSFYITWSIYRLVDAIGGYDTHN